MEKGKNNRIEDRKRIGKRIAEEREKRGLLQSKLTKLVGIDVGYIARIEAGKYSAGIDVLSRSGNSWN